MASHTQGSVSPIDRVLSRRPDARRGEKGWTARCPHHEDSSASLSIAEGADGRALIHCFAGCPSLDVEAVVTTVTTLEELDGWRRVPGGRVIPPPNPGLTFRID